MQHNGKQTNEMTNSLFYPLESDRVRFEYQRVIPYNVILHEPVNMAFTLCKQNWRIFAGGGNKGEEVRILKHIGGGEGWDKSRREKNQKERKFRTGRIRTQSGEYPALIREKEAKRELTVSAGLFTWRLRVKRFVSGTTYRGGGFLTFLITARLWLGLSLADWPYPD